MASFLPSWAIKASLIGQAVNAKRSRYTQSSCRGAKYLAVTRDGLLPRRCMTGRRERASGGARLPTPLPGADSRSWQHGRPIHRESPAMNFRQLHRGPGLLKIANVWDTGSAVLVQGLGVPALATTSAGLAWALGYADGNHLPIAEHAAALKRIARVARVPLSADSEAGYSDDPAAAAENVMPLGVRRLSAGSAIAEAAWGRAQRAAAGFVADGGGGELFDGAAPYPQINGALNAANSDQG